MSSDANRHGMSRTDNSTHNRRRPIEKFKNITGFYMVFIISSLGKRLRLVNYQKIVIHILSCTNKYKINISQVTSNNGEKACALLIN